MKIINSKEKSEKTKEIINHWSLFPNIDTLGYYDALTQTITLNSVEKAHILALGKKDFTASHKEFYKLFTHELSHWLDHLSTYWGTKFLFNIYLALTARMNENIEEFPNIMSLWKEIQKNRMSSYFTHIAAITGEVINVRPWKYSTTAGKRFDSDGKIDNTKPIFFVRFSNTSDEYIARIPLTIVSLLETNAILSEFLYDQFYINTLSDNEKLIEISLFDQNTISWVYNPNLLEYSVATHLVANKINNKEIISSYKLASKIATLTLNVPNGLYDLISTPESLKVFGDLNTNFKKNRDPGYLYAILIENGIEKNINFEDTDAILIASGLPNSNEINDLLNNHYDQLISKAIFTFHDSLKERFFYLVSTGKELFNKRGIDGINYDSNNIIFDGKPLPSIILGDTDFEESLEHGDIEKWIDFIYDFEKRMKEFIEICGI